MGLKEYGDKRDFSKTPEPRPRKPGGGRPGLVYVIQEHDASRLHYDLRLERGGVLQSWAIPKSPVMEEGVRRLAIQTEDHPLGYEDFEGVIPQPEYGAGTVKVWDRGVYTPVETAPDRLVVDIDGRRLKGRFALIRIKAREGSDKAWLFFKMKARRDAGVKEPE
jgi:DNA ligase D-like protein (predicted 3'-phosphoesterase)